MTKRKHIQPRPIDPHDKLPLTHKGDIPWYQIPKHEFLRATNTTNSRDGIKVVVRIVIQEGSQLLFSNLNDKVESILQGLAAYSMYHMTGLQNVHSWRQIFDSPIYAVGVAGIFGMGGRIFFLGLTKPVIKAIFNTRRKVDGGINADS